MAETEQRLFSFGPFGVSVGAGPYGTFRWRKKNVTTIELTDRCLRGISSGAFGFFGRRSLAGDPVFEIPYAAIISAFLIRQPAGLGLMQVLEIAYREAGQVREQSIASFNGRMEEAFAILRRHTPQLD